MKRLFLLLGFLLCVLVGNAQLKWSAKDYSAYDNGFASGVLWVCAVYQMIRSIMGIATGCITMDFDATTGALDVLSGVLSVLIAIAIILVVNKKKCGIYAFFSIEIIHIILGGVIGGGTAYAFGRYTGIALFQIVLLSVLLCLKKNGKTGWKVVLGK